MLGHSKNLSQCINNSYAVSGKYLSLLVELLEIVSTLLRSTITFVDGKLRVLVEIQVYDAAKRSRYETISLRKYNCYLTGFMAALNNMSDTRSLKKTHNITS